MVMVYYNPSILISSSDSAELEKIDPNTNTAQTCRLEQTDREQIIYHPQHSLTDRDIDQFLIIARFFLILCIYAIPFNL